MTKAKKAFSRIVDNRLFKGYISKKTKDDSASINGYGNRSKLSKILTRHIPHPTDSSVHLRWTLSTSGDRHHEKAPRKRKHKNPKRRKSAWGYALFIARVLQYFEVWLLFLLFLFLLLLFQYLGG